MDYKEISPSVLPPTSDVDSTDQLDEDKKLSDSLSVSTNLNLHHHNNQSYLAVT